MKKLFGIMAVALALSVAVVFLSNGVIVEDTFSECEFYKSFENAKSVFGGYVPPYCK